MPVWQLLLGAGVAAWLITQVVRDRIELRRRVKQNTNENAESAPSEDGN